jgi:hypothetical protein
MPNQSTCATVMGTSFPATPEKRQNSLENFLAAGYGAIEGWLLEPAVHMTLALADIQRSLVPAGPVCEIGVWQGRYLALLSFVSAELQPVIGVDMFTHVADRDLQISRLYHNINAWFQYPKQVRIVQKDSRLLTSQELLELGKGQFKFISVDGDHTLPGCLHDLRLADQVIAPAGIVAVDDIMNPTCPGVIEAVMRYGSEPGCQLAPFAIVGNKLFMTQPQWCDQFRRSLLDRCTSGAVGPASRPILDFQRQMDSLRIPVRFLGQEILVHP